MSSGVDLRVNRSLEVLQSLKQTASAFAKREERLSRDLKARHLASERKYRDTMAAAESHYSAQMTATTQAFQHEKERIKAVYQRRQSRVQNFYIAGLRDLPRNAQAAKEKWLGDLQMRKYRGEKKLTTDLAAADAAYSEVAARLEADRTALSLLERRAKKAFRGYWTPRRLLRAASPTGSRSEAPVNQQLDELEGHFKTAEDQLQEFSRFLLPRLFSLLPLPVLFLLIVAAGTSILWPFGFHLAPCVLVGAVSLVLIGVVWFFHHRGLVQSKPSAATLATAIVAARQVVQSCSAFLPGLASQREKEHQRSQEEHASEMDQVQQEWSRAPQIETEFIQAKRHRFETRVPRIFKRIDAVLPAKLQRLDAGEKARTEWLGNEAVAYQQQATVTHDAETAALTAEETTGWDEIVTDWRREITPLYQTIEAMNAEVSTFFPPWNAAMVESWSPASRFVLATKFGHLDLDLAKQPGSIPKDPRLALPGPSAVSVPVALSYPTQGSLLFETADSGTATVVETLNNIVLRLLTTTPPGKVSFTIIDPIGLGQSFAGLMYLADYQESLINRRIWTQRDQIEERLDELSQHIEKVIQMYLRNEYETITEYNEQAGSVAEKYHFLVVADFPTNFSETAAKRLQSIAMSGARCGIFTLIHWDQRKPLPDGFVPDELRKNSICIRRVGKELALGKEQAELGASLVFDPPPDPELAVTLVHQIGKRSVDSNRVEVPFAQIIPKPEDLWKGDTTSELRVAIGRTGATKLQYLAMGKGTRQHALFAGKTGSGKSTLFHVIITNLALTCSPEQVEFYLIDFKKGVEFKCYATKHLPHAKVVAIESDREFALSVLQRVDGELRRRGDIFRKLGVQDIPGYKRAGGAEPMPRSLLIIDEFQEFFVQDDTIAQTASLLFDRIVRQGRAFGIHVLLGSQTLGGAYSLARATLGQMAIRVALQCNEADSYLIMDENNSAPRLLSRPGEGIYNDASGAMEGNSPFQVVWLPDDERDQWLDKVRELADRQVDRSYSNPIVFEGNVPADIRENNPLQAALDVTPAVPPVAARCWLGAPNSIKGPTEIVFQRQSGRHLLIVGQREETGLVLLGLSMLALAAQYPRGTAKFVLLQSTTPGSAEADFIDRIVKAIPHDKVLVQGSNVSPAIHELAVELKNRLGSEAQAEKGQTTFLFVQGLQRFRQLRHEDDFSFSMAGADAAPDPGAEFNEIISEGSSHGMHIITTVDTLNSINHFMNRKALTEFEMRVIFQMSANDSASLIDSPQASNLGLHRALYYNEHEGYLETFRPYAEPDSEWLRQVSEKLAGR